MAQAPERAVDSAVVYEAVNLVNGHRYIGFTVQGLPRREWQHRGSVTHKGIGSRKFKHALKKYGNDNFVFRVIADFEGDVELGLLYEYEAIAKYRPEYNLRGGGMSGGSISLETRQKMSAVQKGRPSPLRGVPISAAHRQAIIDGKKKRDNRHSEEAKERMRAAQAKRVYTEEDRARMRATINNMRDVLRAPVYCVTDGKAFASCAAASYFYGRKSGSVSNALRKNGRIRVVGRKERLQFAFVTEEGIQWPR